MRSIFRLCRWGLHHAYHIIASHRSCGCWLISLRSDGTAVCMRLRGYNLWTGTRITDRRHRSKIEELVTLECPWIGLKQATRARRRGKGQSEEQENQPPTRPTRRSLPDLISRRVICERVAERYGRAASTLSDLQRHGVDRNDVKTRYAVVPAPRASLCMDDKSIGSSEAWRS